MFDPRLEKLAEVLVQYSTGVKHGDLVLISAEPGSMPAVEACYRAVLRAGGHPSFRLKSESLQEILLRHGSEQQIRHVCPLDMHLLANCDVMIVLKQPVNSRFLGRIDPAKAVMGQAARQAGLSAGMQRLAAGTQRYVLTEIPSNAAAQDAGMSLTDYSEWIYQAGFLHLDDPVAAWRRLHAQQAKACDHLQSKHELRFQSPPNHGIGHRHEGTDVTVDVSGRKWLNCAGDRNFPDGELDSGPRGVDGVVNSTFPTVFRGQEVDGIRLRFKAGRVTEASATKNEAYLIALLDQDAGARVAGEIGIGTNYRLTDCSRDAFFDEKIGGTFHLALGAGYPETGNTNESSLHWDIVTDLRAGGTISADGELIQRDGKFLLDGWPKG